MIASDSMMESPSNKADNMVSPSMLDLLIVTFNCGKAFIETKPFASALYGGLKQNATGLPDLVVFSLQEISPVTDAYLGPAWLGKYYQRFEEAVNLAATKVLTTTTSTNEHHDSTQTQTADFEGIAVRASHPYTLVQSKNVGMTAVLLFARDPTALHHIQGAETGFGVMNMGNKGAVALRGTYSDAATSRSTELTFVAAHLTHGEAALQRRNENWENMVSELTFENPRIALGELSPSPWHGLTSRNGQEGGEQPSPASTSRSGTSDGQHGERASDDTSPEPESDSAPLLQQPTTPSFTPTHMSTLHNISMFKPSSHLFVAGDLNYRISDTEPRKSPPPIVFPSLHVSADDERHWSHFLSRDQLNIERAAGRTCHGLSEADINFGPSYKYEHVEESEMDQAENEIEAREGREVAWKFAAHRWPSWCDRILFLNVGGWVKRRNEGMNMPTDLEVKAYDMLPLLATSDHRPVFLRVNVPILSPEEMAPPRADNELGGSELREDEMDDPRVTLPVPINVDSWAKRDAGRYKELWTGWGGLLTSTKEGAYFIGTVLAVCGATWFLMNKFKEPSLQV